MPVILNLEDKIINLIRGERYKWFTTGVNLGGVTGVSGGTGAPIGGFIGQLIQSKVTYDTTENEIWDVPVSGESLVTNLDRIRFRLAAVESGGGGTTLAILDDGDWVASGVETLDFIGAYDITSSGTTVILTFSGGGGGITDLEDLSDVVITSVSDNEVLAYDSGGDWINQTAAEAGLSETGHTHVETDITDLDHDAVSIQGIGVSSVTPVSGEVLVYNSIEWYPDTVSGGGGDTDTKQVKVSADDTTEGYLEDKIVAGASVTVTTLNDGSDEDVEISVSGLSVLGHSHVEVDITDLEHDAVKIQGRTVAATAPTDGQALAWNSISTEWEPQTVSGSSGTGLTYLVQFEDLTSQVPDTADDFWLSQIMVSGSLQVHKNGLLQQPDNYSETSTSGFHTDFSPISGDELMAQYLITFSGGGGSDHDSLTVEDTDSINLELTGQALSGYVLPGGVDHDQLLNFTSTEHFTEGSIDHVNIQSIGSNSHDDLDAHVASGSIHFTEESISHLNIQDIGDNAHSAIDSHITDTSIHFDELDELSDVNAGAPNDGEALAWRQSANEWVASGLGGGTGHDAVTVEDTDSLNLELTGQALSGYILPDGVDHDSLLNFETDEHFTEASIDHTNITNIGTNSHDDLDAHVASGSIHFTEGSISHLNIQDIGNNAHSVIDSHIIDTSIHFDELGELSNVSASAPDTNDSLVWTGSQWGPVAISGGASGQAYILEDLTGQVPDAGDDFWLANTLMSGSLRVYYNGLIQQPTNYAETSASGFHTYFSPVTNDELFAQYLVNDLSGSAVVGTIQVEENDAVIQQRLAVLNFEGSGLESVVDEGNNKVTVTVSGGGGAEHDPITVEDTASLNLELTNQALSGYVLEAGVNHDQLLNFETDEHFTEASIDHTNIANIGTNSHDDIDAHLASGIIHFTEESISHLNIQDIGSNSHSAIDTHITNEPSTSIATHAAIADAHQDPVTVTDTASLNLELTGQALSGYVLDDSHTHIEANITDLDHDAVKLQGRAISTAAPDNNDSLVWNGSVWTPISISGGSGTGETLVLEDVTNQVPDTGDDFFVANTMISGSLSVFYNGLIQQPTNYAETSASGFHTYFSPVTNDELFAQYLVEDVVGKAVVGTIQIEEDDAVIQQRVAVLNFEGDGVESVVDEGSNKVTVTISGGGGGGVTDHGALTGLSDDDHPQYPQAATAETISGAWVFANTFEQRYYYSYPSHIKTQVAGGLYHVTDSSTGFDTTANIRGNNVVILGNAAQELANFTPTAIILNDPGNDTDFRVESTNQTHALFVEGSSGRTTIAGDTPIPDLVDSTYSLTVGSGLGSTNIGIYTSSAKIGMLAFADSTTGTGAYEGSIQYNHSTDQMHIQAGHTPGLSLTASEVTTNWNGWDQDFRIKGENDNYLLFADASTDRVGIGTNDPQELLHVDGDILSSGSAIKVLGTSPSFELYNAGETYTHAIVASGAWLTFEAHDAHFGGDSGLTVLELEQSSGARFSRYLAGGSTPQAAGVFTTRKSSGTISDGFGSKLAFRASDDDSVLHWQGGIAYAQDFTNDRSELQLMIKSGAADTYATTKVITADYTEIVINDQEDDRDFRVAGNTIADVFKVNAGEDVAEIHQYLDFDGATASGIGRSGWPRLYAYDNKLYVTGFASRTVRVDSREHLSTRIAGDLTLTTSWQTLDWQNYLHNNIVFGTGDGEIDHDLSVNPDEITVQGDGTYQINLTVSTVLTTGTTGTSCEARVLKNGTQIAGSLIYLYNHNATYSGSTASCTFAEYYTHGDVLTTEVKKSGTDTVVVKDTGTTFYIEKISQ